MTAMSRTIATLGFAAFLLPASAGAGAPPGSGNEDFTSSFRLEDCEFESTGDDNPYFILEPGRQLAYEAEDETLFITVLPETRRITLEIGGKTRTVRTRIVEEREFDENGLKEVSRNYFVICDETSDVFYFGEDVDIFEPGQPVSHDGAWLAGRDGAKPGIVMPGTFLLGSRYFQEVAAGVALDRAEHTAEGLAVETKAGDFEGCVEVTETTPLEPGAESVKVYCPGVGLVMDGDLELVDIVEGDSD
jgi:hypothetical protein